MHFLMYVTIALAAGISSEEARISVHERLITDDSFCGSAGRFGAPLCDWFVIGGRWSGHLAEELMDGRHVSAARARFSEIAAGRWSEKFIAQNATELNNLWTSHGGSGPSRYTRTGYEEFGYDDDAMLVTPELYRSILAEYQGETLVLDGSRCRIVDLDGEPIQPDFIGRKWLVVVDYHS